MEIKNYNVSFSGLGVKGVIKPDKLGAFIADRSNLINKLEEYYGTDVFLSADMAKVSLKHRLLGNLVGMQDIPVSKFTNKNENEIVKLLGPTIENAKIDKIPFFELK